MTSTKSKNQDVVSGLELRISDLTLKLEGARKKLTETDSIRVKELEAEVHLERTNRIRDEKERITLIETLRQELAASKLANVEQITYLEVLYTFLILS